MLRSRLFLITFVFLKASASLAQGLPVTCLPLEDGLTRGCGLLPDQESKCSKDTAPFYLESCLYQNRSELISEIVDLPIPTDEDILKKMTIVKHPLVRDPRKKNYPMANLKEFPKVDQRVFTTESEDRVVKSLLYRVYQAHDLPQIRALLVSTKRSEWNTLVSLFDEVEMQIAFKPKYAENIGKVGFLNMYQTGFSSGFKEFDRRFDTEQAYWRLSIQTLAATPESFWGLFPKYAFAVSNSKTSGLATYSSYSGSYGTIIAKLNSRVALHATVSPSDSLLDHRFDLTDPNGLGTFRRIKKKNTYLKEKDTVYGEAQILGTLKASDVDYLIVNCYSDLPKITDSETLILKAAFERPIYGCSVNISFDNGEEKTVEQFLSFSPNRSAKVRIQPNLNLTY